MGATFKFLTRPETYEADLPAGFSTATMALQTTAVLNGTPRTVCFQSVPLASIPFTSRFPLTARLTDSQGRGVYVYSQPDPAVDFLCWDLGDAALWTWVQPQAEGAGAIQALLSGLQFVASSGVANLTLGGGLAPGDLRRFDERDEIIFYATNTEGVRFTWAGAFASDATLGGQNGGAYMVTRGSSLGLNVTCDSPTLPASALAARADAVIATLHGL